MTGVSETTRTPYVGPRAFEQEESDLFFGRDQEIEILAGLVMARRAALFFAQSGAGKSSLLRAGLIPELTRQERVGRGRRARTYQKMRILPILTVGGAPPTGLRQPPVNVYTFNALSTLLSDTNPDDLVNLTLAGALTAFFSTPDPTDQPPDSSLSDLPTVTSTLLIFDQFEDLFTHHPTRRREREEFFHQVCQALDAYPSLHVLFSMREDYIAELTPYAVLLPEQLRPRFRLEFLSQEAARLAIQQPARRAGVEFTAEATTKLVDDLRRVRVQRLDGTLEEQIGSYVEPVQLQVVCHRLWAKLPPGATQIVAAGIEAVGDVDSALAGYYAERVTAVAAETGVSERVIRDWVGGQLITEHGIRGQVLQGPEQSQGLDNRAIWLLVDAHLLRAEKRRGATWFELAHDRLVEPVRTDNEAWYEAHLSPLQRRAALWEDENRQEGLLLHGQALTEAQAWAAVHDDELTNLEREFVKESAQAVRLQSARRLRIMFIGAAILLAVFAVLTALTGYSAYRSGIAEDAAIAAENTADAARLDAEQKAIVAAEAQAKSEMAKNTAIAAWNTAEAARIEAERKATAAAAADARAMAAEEDANKAAEAQAESTKAAGATQVAGLEATLTAQARPTIVEPTPSPSSTPSPTPSSWPTATATNPNETPTPSPTATSTPDHAATATLQALENQLAEVQATGTAIARCPFEPKGEFAELWQAEAFRDSLGCPQQANPSRIYFAEQSFENGYMFWSQSPDLYIVIIDQPATWYLFQTDKDVTWTWNEGPSCDVPPRTDDQIQPVRGFGSLWCANPDIRKTIGFATEKEKGVSDNLLQEFENGYILRDSNNIIYILYTDDWTYQKIDMAFVGGGQLLMGSFDNQGYSDERPQHWVTVSDFWIDRFEVTNGDYKKCVAARVCAPPHHENGQPQVDSATQPHYYTDPDLSQFPVIFVGWHDARNYCEWLGMRLPTEAEWEWAAKGAMMLLYPWGKEPPSPSLANYGRYEGDTTQVGSYEPSTHQIYDLAGNVWEWTSSLFWPYPYSPDDGREDPETDGLRVLRGGSWRDGPDSLRTTNRDAGTEPDSPLDNVGFRCAR